MDIIQEIFPKVLACIIVEYVFSAKHDFKLRRAVYMNSKCIYKDFCIDGN